MHKGEPSTDENGRKSGAVEEITGRGGPAMYPKVSRRATYQDQEA